MNQQQEKILDYALKRLISSDDTVKAFVAKITVKMNEIDDILSSISKEQPTATASPSLGESKATTASYHGNGGGVSCCALVNLNDSRVEKFRSMREACRFLGISEKGLTRKFATHMVVGEWRFMFL